MGPKTRGIFFGLFLLAALECRSTAVKDAFAQSSDSAEAEQFFRAARAAFDRREFRAAAAAFEEAYRHSQHGAVLYNAGVAWQLASDEPHAADAFSRALARGDLDPPATRDAERRLGELVARLGRVEIKGVPQQTVSIAHVRDGHPPLVVHVIPGHHVVTVVDAPQATPATHNLDVSAGTTVTIELPPPPPPPQRPKVPPPPRTESSPLPWIVGGSLAGVAVLSVGAAAYFGTRTLSVRDDYEASGYTDANLREEALDLKTATNVFWGTAVVTGALGVILFFALPSERIVGSSFRGGGIAF